MEKKFILEPDLTREKKDLYPEGVADAAFAMGKNFEEIKKQLTEVQGIRLTEEQEKRIRRRMSWWREEERHCNFKNSSILEK